MLYIYGNYGSEWANASKLSDLKRPSKLPTLAYIAF